MSIILILVLLTVILTFIVVGPIIGKKLFPPPVSGTEFSVMVRYPHGLSKGDHITVEGDTLEVINVEGAQVTFRKVSK